MPRLLLCAALLLLGSATPTLATPGQCLNAPLTGSATASDDDFGGSLDVDGSRLIVGARREDSPGTNAGAAYVFDRIAGAWTERARLVADDAQVLDGFGSAVAIEGSRALVGAWHAGGSGAVYAFEEGPAGWTQVQRISHSGGEFGFGNRVVIAGDFAVVSAFTVYTHDDAVYVFERTGGLWIERQRIPASGLAQFGSALALDGDRLVVGAPGLRQVHVYERQASTFAPSGVLTVSAGASQFGFAVDVEGNRIVVGANYEGQSGLQRAGAAYVFDHVGGSWVETTRIVPGDPEQDAYFGSSIAVEGPRIVVGAPRLDDPVSDHGAVYGFALEAGTWLETSKVRACDVVAAARVGAQLDLESGRAAISAPTDDVAGNQSGAVYVLDVLGSLGTRYCPAVPNSSGAAAYTEVRGVPVVSANELLLSTTELPSGRFGYYLSSMSQGFLPTLGGGAGNLCFSLPIVRLAGSILNSGPEGAVELMLDLTALPPGAVLFYRFRDVGNTSNTSDAVAITFETHGAPAAQFPVTLVSQVEEAVQLSVTVTLSQVASDDVLVPYTTGGTATYNVDWRIEELNPIVIPTGQTSYPMTITVAEDGAQEGDETALITLGVPTGGELGTAPQFTLTIVK